MKAAAIVQVLLALLFVVGGATVCAWIGYDIGQGRAAKQVAGLNAKVDTLNGQLALAQSVNQGNAGQLTSLRKTLSAERDRLQQQEQAAQAELAARASRIAQLQQAADKRLDTITRKANQDEDCAALRTLPVCAAVAERLWGDAATVGTH